MNRQVRLLGNFFAILLLVGGVADLIIQYLEGNALSWRVPLILMGSGVGLPLIIMPFTVPEDSNNSEMNVELSDVEVNQEYLKGTGVLSSLDSSEGDSGLGGSGNEHIDID